MECAVEFLPRVHAEVFGEYSTSLLVHGDGVGLPAALVEPGHELGTKPFPEGELLDERGEFVDDLTAEAEDEIGVGLLLQDGQA